METKNIIKHPLSTEKSIRLMESENTLIFIVERNAAKQEIKKAVEDLFKASVAKVRTEIDSTGRKRAYVKFLPSTPAIDIATNLGLM